MVLRVIHNNSLSYITMILVMTWYNVLQTYELEFVWINSRLWFGNVSGRETNLTYSCIIWEKDMMNMSLGCREGNIIILGIQWFRE